MASCACRDSERAPIESLLAQVGWNDRIQGIITLADLNNWYRLCLNEANRDRLADTLLSDLRREFTAEFPTSTELDPFMRERGYDGTQRQGRDLHDPINRPEPTLQLTEQYSIEHFSEVLNSDLRLGA